MTLPDFLESIFSRLATWSGDSKASKPVVPKPIAELGSPSDVVGLLERAPLFVLGSWDDIVQSISDFRKDLVENLANGLMMPFPSIAVAFEGKGGWTLEWIHRTGAAVTHIHTPFLASQERAWFRNAIEFEYNGKRDGHFLIQLAPESAQRYMIVDGRAQEAVAQDVGWIIEDALLRVALISHPENYVVKQKPKLTPREQRKVDRGEPIPIRKRPYYVVLDHTGLVRLRQEATSTALRLPLPHARRGHWMRLAQRCVAARSTGKDKVWRRETYVGDTEFESPSIRFEVFMSAGELAKADGERA